MNINDNSQNSGAPGTHRAETRQFIVQTPPTEIISNPKSPPSQVHFKMFGNKSGQNGQIIVDGPGEVHKYKTV